MYRESSSEELVYLAFSGHVIALSRDRGEVAWRHDLGTRNETSIHVEEDVVLAVCGSELVALDPTDGTQQWRTLLPFAQAAPTLMLVDRDAIFLSQSGEIACVDRAGTLRWSDPLNGTGYGVPTLAVRGRSARLTDRG
jgi:outer membrane protein assembly factor BamB